jgi:anti-anti-sigma factor
MDEQSAWCALRRRKRRPLQDDVPSRPRGPRVLAYQSSSRRHHDGQRRDQSPQQLGTGVGAGGRSRAIGGPAATALVSYPDGTPTVCLSGELDLRVAATIERQLVDLSATHVRVDLDVSALEFIDAAGLHALIASARHARRHGRRLEVRRPLPRSLGRLIALTGVGSQLGLSAGARGP